MRTDFKTNDKDLTKHHVDILILMITSIIFSIVAQINDERISGVMRIIMYSSWGVTIAYMFLNVLNVFRMTYYGKWFLMSYIGFVSMCGLSTVLGQEHMSPNILLPFSISLIMYLTGSVLQQYGFPVKKLDKCLFVFCISVFVVCIVTRFTFFTNISDWLNTNIYVYDKKNSLGQLIVLAVILLVFYFKPNKKLVLFIYYAISAFMIYVLLLIQCRTAMVALVIVIIARLFIVSKERSKFLLLLLVGVLFILFNDNFWNIIEKAFFIDKYKGLDLNTFSSGRFTYYADALNKFQTNVWFGTGEYYVDNFFINMLTENGIIGFIIIIPVLIKKAIDNLFRKSSSIVNEDKRKLNEVLKLFTLFYIVESMLEGFPPLGPGVCAFLFWLLNGYLDSFARPTKTTGI
jgi:hypothetical protein